MEITQSHGTKAEIHVSDPTWDPRPSESNAIPPPGFHGIHRIPVGSDKILYWIRDESNTKDRLAEFAKEVITLGEQNVTISPQMLKELSEKYHISPPST
ncbi:unnamed protein product [Adineta ricciae]|uniref:Uncharacterized protein n=1 Tax=Adineta ricciae TaxID=249248 RepID=A0A815TI67_ADIRI|nr:unnamed protein product [Adineta ricciae]